MSTVKLFIARHGNTFESSKEAYYVGSKIDLELTEKGMLQAKELGRYFADIKVDAIFSGELKRQIKTANIIKETAKINKDIVFANALNEINYGVWEGMKVEEIIESYPKEFNEWTMQGKFSKDFDDNFLTRKKLLSIWVKSLIERGFEKIIAVSSNGIMKLLLSLTPNWNSLVKGFKLESFKVKTGNFCEIDIDVDGKLKIVSWNVTPVLAKAF